MSHKHSVKVKLTADRIRAVPGLVDRLPDIVDLNVADTIPPAWGCEHSCDWVKIFGLPFYVDFTSNTILEHPDSRPCERAPAAIASAGTSASAASQKHVKHSRVDPLTQFGKFKQATLARAPQVSIHDEGLMGALGPDKALQLQFVDKLPPSSFLVNMRMLAVQVGEVEMAHVAAIAATITKDQAKTVRNVNVPKSLVATGATGNAPLDVLTKNVIILGSLVRGLLEYADYAALSHRTFYATISFHAFMEQLTTNMRPDVAEITSTIQNAAELTKDLSSRLDGNTFYVLGVLALSREKTSLEEFFRKETSRLTTVAKACGWKPTTDHDKKQPAAPATATGAAAGKQTDQTKKRTITQSQKTDTKPTTGRGSGASKRAKKKRAAAAAAASAAGAGAGTGTSG